MAIRRLSAVLIVLFSTSAALAQQHVGFQAAPAATAHSAGGTTTHYEKVPYYDSYGRLCYHYRQVTVQAPVQKAEPLTVTNPIGQQNTDNSVTYQYTYNISYGQFPADQGSTVYGYPSSLFESADVYGNIDLGAQLDGMNRLAGQLGSDATSVVNGFKDTVDRLGANQARIAEIRANKDAIVATLLANSEQTRANAELAKALRASDSLHYERRENITRGDGQTRVNPDPANPNPVPAPAPSAQLQAVQAIVDKSCASCHNPGSKKGGLDLSDLRAVTNPQAKKIVDRITTAESSRRMPPRQEGHEPVLLTPDEIATIIKAMN